MDWNGVIEKNREALKRLLVSLVAMAAVTGGGATLPRHLHRAVLRLLRPAEAAVRRLVIVAARDVVVALPPPRPRKVKPESVAPVLRSLGIAVVVSHNVPHAELRGSSRTSTHVRAARRQIALPLLDPLSIPRPGRPRYVPAHAAPRILAWDGPQLHRLPQPPSPDDPIDATRLTLRLDALASALDDLPKHARRFARWKMRRAATARKTEGLHRGLGRRISPLRPGRPPGQRSARSRQPAHEVHDVLSDLHYFAFKALQQPDTS